MKAKLKVVSMVVLSLAITTAPGVAADTKDLMQWQNVMRQACRAMNSNEFQNAQTQFEQALTLANASRNDDAKFLSLLSLGDAMSEQGQYPQAEEVYRQATALPDGDDAFDYVARALEKQNKFDEANTIRKQHYATCDDALARKDAERVLGKAFGKQVQMLLHHQGSSFATIAFRLPPIADEHATGFLSLSDGNSFLNHASEKALNAAKLPNRIGGSRGPFWFTFFSVGIDAPASPVGQSRAIDLDAVQSPYVYRVMHERVAKEEATLGANHLESLSTMTGAADMLLKQGRVQDAEKACHHVISNCNSQNYKCSVLSRALGFLATCLVKQKKFAEAEEALRDRIALNEKIYASDSADVIDAQVALLNVLEKQHKKDEAKSLFDKLPPCARKLARG